MVRLHSCNRGGSVKDASEPTRRAHRGCSGRPCRRPASIGTSVRSRGWGTVLGHASRHAHSSAVARKSSQSASPAALVLIYSKPNPTDLNLIRLASHSELFN